VLAGESKLLLKAERELLTLDRLPAGLRVRDDGFDLCRISKEAILRFLGNGGGPDLDLLPDLRDYFARFAVFRDRRVALLLATWTLGTYCYRIFRVFLYLVLRSSDKHCGKTRVLDEIALVAFNASGPVVHPTEAQAFRGPSRIGGMLLLDEVESLGQANGDLYAGLLAVLNSGFEQGGSVARMEKTAAGNYRDVSYETYCPRALAGLKKLVEALANRAIQITMQRKLKREKLERFSPPRLAHEAQRLRDRCYLWALTQAADIAEIYDEADHPFHERPELDDGARDLWEPLFALVSIADASRDEAALPLTTELMSLAKALGTVREHTGGHALIR
jgi:putative DNA primase/helicase